jgi:hypothetical protein
LLVFKTQVVRSYVVVDITDFVQLLNLFNKLDSSLLGYFKAKTIFTLQIMIKIDPQSLHDDKLIFTYNPIISNLGKIVILCIQCFKYIYFIFILIIILCDFTYQPLVFILNFLFYNLQDLTIFASYNLLSKRVSIAHNGLNSLYFPVNYIHYYVSIYYLV